MEQVKEGDVRGYDHAYKILEDYIHTTIYGKLGWCIYISMSSDSDDGLENWQNRMHEVSPQKCGLIT